ncbi:hypothetical protein DFH09DRAFT_1456435 [Mycena vulgaris]|nr:hypothetical protein DFH09DRAFT_1456435 [Mycena vulgaris]
MTLPFADAMSDVQARTPDAQFLVIHSVEGENLNMAGPTLKKARSTDDFVLVPSELVYKANDSHDNDSGSSGDEISIQVESPREHDDSLSSSALTATTSQLGTDDATVTDDADPPPRRSRVHFRSRVRITSGLPRHSRHLSATSSLNSSSSSISAPLRSPLTEENCSPGWGTLGKRVGLFALSNRQAAALAAQARSAKQRGRRRQGVADLATNERTALLGNPAPPGYDGYDPEEEDGYFSSDDEYDEEAVLSRQIDLVFGKWPQRLLNRHWWWWQLQPVISCGCLDESDGED